MSETDREEASVNYKAIISRIVIRNNCIVSFGFRSTFSVIPWSSASLVSRPCRMRLMRGRGDGHFHSFRLGVCGPSILPHSLWWGQCILQHSRPSHKAPWTPLISRNLDNSGLDPLPPWYVIISSVWLLIASSFWNERRKQSGELTHIHKSLKFSKLRLRGKKKPLHYFDPIFYISLICILLSFD